MEFLYFMAHISFTVNFRQYTNDDPKNIITIKIKLTKIYD